MPLSIYIVLAFAVGAAAAWLVGRAAASGAMRVLQGRLDELQRESADRGEKLIEAARAEAELAAVNRALAERLATGADEIARVRGESQLQFEQIASKILEDKSRRFTETNRENIAGLLKPLGENIDKFRRKVEETYDRESKERFSLGREVERLARMNQQISEEAGNLTRALKGNNKTQGNWGEMILENILEQSGLRKDREYFLQETLRDDAGSAARSDEGRRMIPDVIVHYPDGRKVIIDSKVSLNDYVEYSATEDKAAADRLAARHVASVKRHVDELTAKNYQAHVASLDFVLMFVPNEPAYMLALQTDPGLWSHAYNRGVVLISPTNLVTSLRLIHDLWKRDDQSRNALEIADRGGQLYDKFVGFVGSMARIGDQLKRTRDSYDEAMTQLSEGRGNLIGQAEKLRALGVRARKRLTLVDKNEDEPLSIENKENINDEEEL